MYRLLLLLLPVSILSAQSPESAEFYEAKIRPLFAKNCYACHASNTPTAQGGLKLDSPGGILKGGNSGPLIDKEKPENSILLRAISHEDKDLKMPPGKALPGEAIADIEDWVFAGAPLPKEEPKQAMAKQAMAKQPKLWSLQALAAPPGDIDSFIRAKLAEKNLTPAPPASKRTLLRRLSFDLTGLPPAKAELDAFEADNSPRAYEKAVDRLLASPHFGERWARHWLDVARYADSANDAVNNSQKYPWSYTYRDWVIRSLNEDLPYDKFVLYQLAADRIPKLPSKHLAALGFLTLGREFPKNVPETIDDRIDAVTRGFLGFTVACARCHDHKYDPIPTRDYYSLYSIFVNTKLPDEFPPLAPIKAMSAKDKAYHERLARAREAQKEYQIRRHKELLAFFTSQAEAYKKAAADAEKLNALEVEEMTKDRQLNSYMLARWRQHRKDPVAMPDPLAAPLSDFALMYTEGDSNNSRELRNRYNFALVQYAYDGAAPRGMALEDLPQPKPVSVFLRGNPSNPGAPAPPRFLTALAGEDSPVFREGSGRLELARAIVDPKNPLTPRVIVNRIWAHYFGQGLVRTPSDFGFRGDAPTHPELLDRLAIDFMAGGWSLKTLHKRIVMSETYRQSSDSSAAAEAIDPENHLLWRMPRKRLEIEALRDSMLAASGQLKRDLGGLPFPLDARPSVPRRTVYAFVERGKLPAALSAFDFASPDQHAPMRFVTTVPQQALFFLNSPFVAEQATYLAKRVQAQQPRAAVQAMYEYVFGRLPSEAELAAGLRFTSESSATQDTPAPSVWRYGFGEYDDAKQGVIAFTEFPVFTNESWQGAAILPTTKSGIARLTARGGEPVGNPTQAVIRRWVSPAAGTVQIEGSLRHNQSAVVYGDGVRGRIVSSRRGVLGEFLVNGKAVDTKASIENVEPGDTIDFLVDNLSDPERDGFQWSPVMKMGAKQWSAKEEFRGPPPMKLDVWARYAQVLLQSNEFAFVD